MNHRVSPFQGEDTKTHQERSQSTGQDQVGDKVTDTPKCRKPFCDPAFVPARAALSRMSVTCSSIERHRTINPIENFLSGGTSAGSCRESDVRNFSRLMKRCSPGKPEWNQCGLRRVNTTLEDEANSHEDADRNETGHVAPESRPSN